MPSDINNFAKAVYLALNEGSADNADDFATRAETHFNTIINPPPAPTPTPTPTEAPQV